MTDPSPRVTRLAWGEIDIDGHGTFKDAKVWPGGAREWDWNETGTRHTPGTQPDDVLDLVEHGAHHVILSRGQQGRLGVMDETLELLADRGVSVDVLGTREAVDRYNELAARGEPVAGLFHSTC